MQGSLLYMIMILLGLRVLIAATIAAGLTLLLQLLLLHLQSAVLGTYFEVAGGPQAGGAANIAPGIPVMSHTTEFGPILGSGAGYMQSEFVWYNRWTFNLNYAQFDIGWFAAAGLAVQVGEWGAVALASALPVHRVEGFSVENAGRGGGHAPVAGLMH